MKIEAGFTQSLCVIRSRRTPSEATMKIKVSQKLQRPQKFFKEHYERVNEVKSQKEKFKSFVFPVSGTYFVEIKGKVWRYGKNCLILQGIANLGFPKQNKHASR